MRANEFDDWSFNMFLALRMMADQNGMSEMSGRKESNCVRCRNHGLKTTLRGHKQYCPYGACSCDKCRFTAEQQRQMRLQNAIRRAEAHDRNGTPGRRQRNSSTTAPTMVSPQLQQPPQQQAIVHQQAPPTPIHQPQQQQIIVTTVASVQPDQRNGGTPHGMKLFHSFSYFRDTNSRGNENQFNIRFFSFLFYVALGRRQKNVFRLQQRIAEKVSLSVGDDADHVYTRKICKRKY